MPAQVRDTVSSELELRAVALAVRQSAAWHTELGGGFAFACLVFQMYDTNISASLTRPSIL